MDSGSKAEDLIGFSLELHIYNLYNVVTCHAVPSHFPGFRDV